MNEMGYKDRRGTEGGHSVFKKAREMEREDERRVLSKIQSGNKRLHFSILFSLVFFLMSFCLYLGMKKLRQPRERGKGKPHAFPSPIEKSF